MEKKERLLLKLNLYARTHTQRSRQAKGFNLQKREFPGTQGRMGPNPFFHPLTLKRWTALCYIFLQFSIYFNFLALL